MIKIEFEAEDVEKILKEYVEKMFLQHVYEAKSDGYGGRYTIKLSEQNTANEQREEVKNG